MYRFDNVTRREALALCAGALASAASMIVPTPARALSADGWALCGSAEWRIVDGTLQLRPENGQGSAYRDGNAPDPAIGEVYEGTLADWGAGEPPWAPRAAEITAVEVMEDTVVRVLSCRRFLSGARSLASFSAPANLDLSAVRDLHAMFSGCSALEQVSFGGQTIPLARDLRFLCYGCSALKSADFLAELDCAQVTNMDAMLARCTALTSLDLSGASFSLDSVINLTSAFEGCSALAELRLPACTTRKLRFLTSAFKGCAALEELDLSHVDLSAVVDKGMMLFGCDALAKLTLPASCSMLKDAGLPRQRSWTLTARATGGEEGAIYTTSELVAAYAGWGGTYERVSETSPASITRRVRELQADLMAADFGS